MDVARINRSHGATEEHEAARARAKGRRPAARSRFSSTLQGLRSAWRRSVMVLRNRRSVQFFTITTRATFPALSEPRLSRACAPARLLIDRLQRRGPRRRGHDTDVVTRVAFLAWSRTTRALTCLALSPVPTRPARQGGFGVLSRCRLHRLPVSVPLRDIKGRPRDHGRWASASRSSLIEKPQAVEALEDIIEAFDGIMVARFRC